MTYIYLIIAIAAEVVATTALKASASFTRPIPAFVVVLGYGIAFYCLSLVLRKMSIGAAYALWSGVGIALITILSFIIYKEKPDPAAIVGLVLITAGVVVLNAFSDSVMHS